MQPERHACAISIESAFWDLVNTARVLAISEGRQSPSIPFPAASDAVLAIFHHRQLSWNATSTHMPQSLTESYIRGSIFPSLFVAHRSGWVLPEKGGRGRGPSLPAATFLPNYAHRLLSRASARVACQLAAQSAVLVVFLTPLHLSIAVVEGHPERESALAGVLDGLSRSSFGRRWTDGDGGRGDLSFFVPLRNAAVAAFDHACALWSSPGAGGDGRREKGVAVAL